MQDNLPLTDEFPYESKWMTVNRHRLHYIDVSEGDPTLFIHGNPTSSYLWRNIIPYLSRLPARCIALDLIGYGKSERPDIDYRFVTHADFIHRFIEQLDLKNITLVMHDWGNALGFYYGLHHLENIKGFAIIEGGSFFKPIPTMQDFQPVQAQGLFTTLRDSVKGPELMKTANPFLSNMKKNVLGRTLSDAAWQKHQSPFLDPESRKPIWTFPTQFPINGEPKEVYKIVNEYSPILQTCATPKILFHATPGCNTPSTVVEWAKRHMHSLATVDIGPGYHYLPEDNPSLIGQELAKWRSAL
jgi:haloalkane dehalogenase